MTAFPALRRKNVESLAIQSEFAVDGTAAADVPTTGALMNCCLAGVVATFILAVAPAMLPCSAQTNPAPAPQSSVPQAQSPAPSGKVIFSRSTDENGHTTTQVGPAAQLPLIEMAKEPTAEDADREAVTCTVLDLDVHLQTAAHQIAVRAVVTVRNDGKTPLDPYPTANIFFA